MTATLAVDDVVRIRAAFCHHTERGYRYKVTAIEGGAVRLRGIFGTEKELLLARQAVEPFSGIEWTYETQAAAAVCVDQWGPVLGSKAVTDCADSAELLEVADAIRRARRARGFAGYGCNANHDPRHDRATAPGKATR